MITLTLTPLISTSNLTNHHIFITTLTTNNNITISPPTEELSQLDTIEKERSSDLTSNLLRYRRGLLRALFEGARAFIEDMVTCTRGKEMPYCYYDDCYCCCYCCYWFLEDMVTCTRGERKHRKEYRYDDYYYFCYYCAFYIFPHIIIIVAIAVILSSFSQSLSSPSLPFFSPISYRPHELHRFHYAHPHPHSYSHP